MLKVTVTLVSCLDARIDRIFGDPINETTLCKDQKVRVILNISENTFYAFLKWLYF